MSPFDHHMYVLLCGDGSLYTGYATDVAARLAAHRAGRGARYTASHGPVRLIAQARFYSKRRAMSAEARFKLLSRAEKDRLLACASHEPFEDVLRRELPGFGDDTACEFVCRLLAHSADPDFARFQARLIPNLDPRTIVGVRTPELRRIARALVARTDAADFLADLPHRLFEERQVHALVLGLERDYAAAVAGIDAFVPAIDNWATCDRLPVRVLAARPEETLSHVMAWRATGRCYPMRLAIRVLMEQFLGERFEPRFLDVVASARLATDCGVSPSDAGTVPTVLAVGPVPPAPPVRAADLVPSAFSSDPVPPAEARYAAAPAPESDAYYLAMMRAWYFAEALVRQPESTWPYLERRGSGALLDEWTRHQAIQKAIESRRVPDLAKQRLRRAR